MAGWFAPSCAGINRPQCQVAYGAGYGKGIVLKSIAMNTKKCSKCSRILPFSEFTPRKSGSLLGLMPACKECERQDAKAYRATRKGKTARRAYAQSQQFKANVRRYKASPKGKLVAQKSRKSEAGKARIHRNLARRRMLLGQVECTLTAAEWREIKKLQKGKCYWCQKKAKLTQDHVIPLAKGGPHTKENVVGACLHCNTSKQDKILTLF